MHRTTTVVDMLALYWYSFRNNLYMCNYTESAERRPGGWLVGVWRDSLPLQNIPIFAMRQPLQSFPLCSREMKKKLNKLGPCMGRLHMQTRWFHSYANQFRNKKFLYRYMNLEKVLELPQLSNNFSWLIDYETYARLFCINLIIANCWEFWVNRYEYDVLVWEPKACGVSRQVFLQANKSAAYEPIESKFRTPLYHWFLI